MNVEAIYSESLHSELANSEPLPTLPRPRRGILRPNSLHNKVLLPSCKSIGKTEKQCCVCNQKNGRSAVPKSAIRDLWRQKKIYLHPNSRTCPHHIQFGKFIATAFEVLEEKSHHETVLNASEVAEWVDWLTHETGAAIINVDGKDFSEYEYMLLLGVTKDQFDDMYSTIASKLRWSVNRSGRNALAIFLCKMRLGVSQKLLAYLFGIESQKKISEVIGRVSELLEKEFVPKHYGYSHISREEILLHHNPTYIQKLYNVPEGGVTLYLDGSYFQVEKSANHVVQKKSFSRQKGHHLLKNMMVVLPTGYILESAGMYYSDDHHNDAKILQHMLKIPNGISSFVQDGDNVVVDRGFRNVVADLTDLNLAVHMPKFLKPKQKQFTCQEANESRMVTLTRWVVEAVNGLLKNVFKFFELVVPNHYFIRNCNEKLGRYIRICCAILNAYHPRIFTESEKHQKILEEIETRKGEENTLKVDLEAKGWLRKRIIWEHVTPEQIEDFPQLSLEDLFEITLGIYQIKNAKGYTDEHFRVHKSYKFTVLKENESLRDGHSLIKAHMNSRFRSSEAYDLWIEYSNAPEGRRITRYYCRCMGGEKSIGCCSHVAGVLWFVGFRRQIEPSYQPKMFGDGILDTAEAFGAQNDNVESEDDEDIFDYFNAGSE